MRGRHDCFWHIAAFATAQHLGRDWTNNGQTSILARISYDVIDPKRTLARRRNLT